MSSFAGPADWWTEGTNSGRTHIATKGIVQTNIVLNLDPGVSSSYPESGTAWTDLSGSGNNGTLSNVTYNSSPAYMSFTSASSSGVSLGTKFNYTTEAFSFSYWIYIDSYTTTQVGQGPVAFWKGSYNIDGYYNDIAPDGTVVFTTSQAGATQGSGTSAGVIPLTTWKNICITRAGAAVRIYINGEAATTTFGTHVDPASSSRNFILGYSAADGYLVYGNMRISSFIGYSRRLLPDEILKNFNALRGRYGV
jgi:hypothetical protein